MANSFRVPGTDGPDIEVRRSIVGNIKVVVNGVWDRRRTADRIRPGNCSLG